MCAAGVPGQGPWPRACQRADRGRAQPRLSHDAAGYPRIHEFSARTLSRSRLRTGRTVLRQSAARRDVYGAGAGRTVVRMSEATCGTDYPDFASLIRATDSDNAAASVTGSEHRSPTQTNAAPSGAV